MRLRRPFTLTFRTVVVIGKRLSAFLVLGLASAHTGCGGGDLTLPSEGEPATITVTGGSPQIGRVGTQLGESLAVKVTDTQDRPVPNATVNFVFDDASAGGSASPAEAVTNAEGIAKSSLTLGAHVGAVSGRAFVPVPERRVPVTAPFTATALPADASGIAWVSGQDQSSAVGTPLPKPLVVQVSDGFGNPIKDVVVVNWSTEGGGSFSATTTPTDENGQASVTWTLGGTAGAQTASASAGTGAVPLAGSPVTFNATATAGNAAKVIKVSGDDQPGAPGSELALPLVVKVLDEQDNPVVGRAVTWVGDGTATPETSTTDAQGQASTHWTISATPGRNTLNAVVSGVGRATFHATGSVVVLTTTTRITSVTPETSTVGQEVTIAFSVTAPGATPTGDVTVTASGGSESCTGSVGSGSCKIVFNDVGNRRITATYAGNARFSPSSDSKDHQVNPANSPPVAGDDAYSTSEDVSLHVPSEGAPGLLANDSDEGENLSAEQLTQPTHGQVTGFTKLGGFDYTPAANFSGEDSFTYQVKDGAGATDIGTVRITVNPVNDAPVAQNDGPYTTPGAGAPLTVAAPGVLANDSDPDGTSPTPQNPSDPPKGSVTLNPDGSFVYTPDLGASGDDSFTYELTDGALTSSRATVTVSITP